MGWTCCAECSSLGLNKWTWFDGDGGLDRIATEAKTTCDSCEGPFPAPIAQPPPDTEGKTMSETFEARLHRAMVDDVREMLTLYRAAEPDSVTGAGVVDDLHRILKGARLVCCMQLKHRAHAVGCPVAARRATEEATGKETLK